MSDIAGLFRSVLAADQVTEDEKARSLAGSDIAGAADPLPACVLAPRSEADVAALVRVAAREGIALHPKGGGWSYTGGYRPASVRSAIVDSAGLQGIEVRDGTVSAGAGVTWAAIDEALKPLGMRVPSFGPLSGIGAMVGAGVAQDGGFFGAATFGAVGQDSVTAVSMVDGTGEVRPLGQRDRYDPVRAPQPLAGDCGAFGIKTRVELRIMPRPAATLFASFAFASAEALLGAMGALVGLAGLGEVFAFDAGVHRNLAATGFSVLEAASVAGDLAGARGAWWDKVGGLLRTARAGKAFLSEIAWSLHISVDGTPAEAESVRLEAARRAAGFGGETIPDVIPRVTRARPFRPIKALAGPAGERWLPVHGLVEPGAAAGLVAAFERILESTAEPREALGVRPGFLIAVLGPRITVEPQLFWPDSMTAYSKAKAQPDQVKRFGGTPDNLAARALAHDVRGRLIGAMDALGAGHFQIGRTYAAHPGAPAEAMAEWAALKRHFDPKRIMNPGALGL